MSLEEVLPRCPSAIATSRPGREAWAREELEDAVALLDGARVADSGHKGLFLIYYRGECSRLLESFLSWEYSFVKSIVLIPECRPCSELADMLRDAASYCRDKVRIMLHLRGECKHVARRSQIESFLFERGVGMSKRALSVFVIESLDGWASAYCGRARVRPYGTLIVLPEWCLREG